MFWSRCLWLAFLVATPPWRRVGRAPGVRAGPARACFLGYGARAVSVARRRAARRPGPDRGRTTSARSRRPGRRGDPPARRAATPTPGPTCCCGPTSTRGPGRDHRPGRPGAVLAGQHRAAPTSWPRAVRAPRIADPRWVRTGPRPAHWRNPCRRHEHGFGLEGLDACSDSPRPCGGRDGARKALDAPGRLPTGKNPPENPADPDVRRGGGALGRRQRRRGRRWRGCSPSAGPRATTRRSTGHLPGQLRGREV